MRSKVALFSIVFSAGMMCHGQAREDFMRQQAYAEMQRVSGQVDVLQSNLNELQRRVGALEGGGDTRGLRNEIDSLKTAVAELRRAMQNQREEIVRDLSNRLAKMQPPPTTPRATQPKRQVVMGPHFEYTVQKGDTLSLVAKAFDTSVKKIREANNLKSDSVRVGQKLNIPKE